MIEINGREPVLDGQQLQEIFCQQYVDHEKLHDEAIAILLRVNNIWYRVYFDWGIICWREDGEEYLQMDADERFPLIDLGTTYHIKQTIITHYSRYLAGSADSIVEFEFENGRMLSFINKQDQTTVIH